MNKNNKEDRENPSVKRQLISIGLYIALAAIVLAVTVGSVGNILGGKERYELPEISDLAGNSENTAGSTVFPEYKTPELYDIPDYYYTDGLPEQKDISYPYSAREDEEPASENADGVTAEIYEPSENGLSSASTDVTPDENAITDNAEKAIASEKLPEVHARPVDGYISREFSKTELLYTPTMNDFRTHDGIDIAGDPGSAVVSYADGVIEDIYDDAMLGKTVVIKHSGGLVTCYGNLSESLPSGIEVGKYVRMGDTVGGIGETAMIESAEVPHVHFEMYIDEMCVDPEEYLG